MYAKDINNMVYAGRIGAGNTVSRVAAETLLLLLYFSATCPGMLPGCLVSANVNFPYSQMSIL